MRRGEIPIEAAKTFLCSFCSRIRSEKKNMRSAYERQKIQRKGEKGQNQVCQGQEPCKYSFSHFRVSKVSKTERKKRKMKRENARG
jgi:hypothetical protein